MVLRIRTELRLRVPSGTSIMLMFFSDNRVPPDLFWIPFWDEAQLDFVSFSFRCLKAIQKTIQ